VSSWFGIKASKYEHIVYLGDRNTDQLGINRYKN